MHKILLFLCFFSIKTFAQNLSENSKIDSNSITKQKLLGEWIKKEIRLKDGSKIFNPNLQNADLRYKFGRNDSVRITYESKTFNGKYSINGTILTINMVEFEVVSLNEKELVLDEANDENGIKIVLQPMDLQQLGFLPKSYISKGNDTVYFVRKNYLEPLFKNFIASPMDFISSKFEFPEFKVGDFLVRFVITKTGEVRAVNVVESTHEKYNKSLVEAVKATKGMWIPATFEGKPVNVEVEMGFDLGWSEKMNRKVPKETDKKQNLELSAQYLEEGNSYYDSKIYKSALKSYNLSIENNYQNVDAYYMRSAVYIILKQNEKACEDLLQLKHLEQKRAESLYFRYCKDTKANLP